MWIQYTWLWAKNFTTTQQINFAPSMKMVQTSLNQATLGSEGGNYYAGVRRYRYRLPSGAEQEVDFGADFWAWPPYLDSRSVGYQTLTSVTFAVTATGGEAKSVGSIFHL